MRDPEKRYEANKIVLAIVGQDKELAEKWWTGYNHHFGQTPNETWEIEPEIVMSYLYGIDSYY
jgi:hypothetical protein